MPSINKITLMGHVTKAPELKQAGNTSVCRFGIATSERYKDHNGGTKENTDFHSVQAWGKLAEVITNTLHVDKGDLVFIEGSVHYRKWDNDGRPQYSTDITVSNFQFISHPKGNGQRTEQTSRPQTQQPAVSDDDLPF